MSITSNSSGIDLGEGLILEPSSHENTYYQIEESFSVKTLEVHSDGIVFCGEKISVTPFEGYAEVGFRGWSVANREFTVTALDGVLITLSNFIPNVPYLLTLGEESEHIYSDGEGMIRLEYDELHGQTINIRNLHPIVETLEADAKSDSAILQGEISIFEVDECEVWFMYRRSGEEGWRVTNRQILYSDMKFEQIISDLQPDTSYQFIAMAEYEAEGQKQVISGDILSFQTHADELSPYLDIVQPDGQIENLTFEKNLTIIGYTEPGAILTIDDEHITVDEGTGYFEHKIKLKEGLNIIPIVATNEHEKTSAENVYALYLPDIPELWDELNSIMTDFRLLEEQLKDLQDRLNKLEMSYEDDIQQYEKRLKRLEERLNENGTLLEESLIKLDLIDGNQEAILNTISEIDQNIDEINAELISIEEYIKSIEEEPTKQEDDEESSFDYIRLLTIINTLILGSFVALIFYNYKENQK